MKTNSTAVAIRQYPGRLYAWLGICAVVIGPVLYTFQMMAKLLTVPWYAPIFATVGLALSVVALVQTRTAWRFIGLGFCGLLAAFQWFVVLSSRLPDYTGPAKVGNRYLSSPPRWPMAHGSSRVISSVSRTRRWCSFVVDGE